MIFRIPPTRQSAYRFAMDQTYLCSEYHALNQCLSVLDIDTKLIQSAQLAATQTISKIRTQRNTAGGISALLREYNLSTKEGIVLMCLAESMLRIPDSKTLDLLIKDKLSGANWEKHLSNNHSLFVNASTWGLIISGKMERMDKHSEAEYKSLLSRLFSYTSETILRNALKTAMKLIARQFIAGQNIADVKKIVQARIGVRHLYSIDMLGEQAMGDCDVQKYFESYHQAIEALAKVSKSYKAMHSSDSVSVKLSALHAQFEYANYSTVKQQLNPLLFELAVKARSGNVALTIDAEESRRLDLTLDIFTDVITDPRLRGWAGLGIVVQAYQKRALNVIRYLVEVATMNRIRIPVRLVKGAYWDSEIKYAQQMGWPDYPVYTRKIATDISYIACAKLLLEQEKSIFPQFATHNIFTLALVKQLAGSNHNYEVQRLHGMAEDIFDDLKMNNPQIVQRVYAPIGDHIELLPYLVRRLLENGANNSFLNKLDDRQTAISQLVFNPLEKVKEFKLQPHVKIPLPTQLYQPQRKNSKGENLYNLSELKSIKRRFDLCVIAEQIAGPIIGDDLISTQIHLRYNPGNLSEVIGRTAECTMEQLSAAFKNAQKVFIPWAKQPVMERIKLLEIIGQKIEYNKFQLALLCIKEAGKTLADALDEIREAEDFCYYYAAVLREQFFATTKLSACTGEDNFLSMHARGVFVCISPWNFPIAIFVGQIVAALAVGNCVLAKPSRHTTLTAHCIVKLIHSAGIPRPVLQLIPVDSDTLSETLMSNRSLAGVAFTGSHTTAQKINAVIANRKGAILPLIAETGGQNVIIADSSALLDQLVRDVIRSAFNSAGQRCSACRVVYVQHEIAEKFKSMLIQAMAKLTISDPIYLDTDIGPMICKSAVEKMHKHCRFLDTIGELIFTVPMTDDLQQKGYYFSPCAYRIPHIRILKEEIFGPILHIVYFEQNELMQIVAQINELGYGLTLGIHSRVESTIDSVSSAVNVGNIYVNRDIVGAIVGSQPFGGEGLSGTGPKAGGPNYLRRFATERTLTINTAATGGNTSLATLSE